ncbi:MULTISPECIES: cytochrome c oxidase assembly protein [unclassified Photobacterium]|uniref:cytochrome c oxidase assembly protein n=1 Tax=unclassified Photobacterium TaxID=2628852 RepID=UPI001B8D75E4|nr:MULTISPECIES: cytochrome c oxidase assembly protein [unclassified Photobacterium]MDO6708491.1 cytochrome c oxidase assembly protein [Photobacterium sp. 1_MG-2023]QUJ67336.1 cytochrome c oxidase assembly protein [Photobacterium sp. GJ3]
MADNGQDKGKKKSLLTLIVLSLGMFGFAFALVPLYDVFCEVTGINGKTSNQAAIASQQVDEKRNITVEFVAYINPGMAWQFEPEVTRMVVHPGETHKVLFAAKNLTKHATVGQAVPSVSPGQGAQYFNKIECFCFNRQPLAAGASAELPLLFYIDPELPEDINTLTLAYTLFNAQPEPAAQTQ